MGPYELIAEVSSGALGARHLALQVEGPEEGRLVLVRRMPRGQLTPATIARVSEVAKTSFALRDAVIWSALDVLETPRELVVVSEYVDGEPLGSLLAALTAAQGTAPQPIALALARDVTTALRVARDQWTRLVSVRSPEQAWLLGAVYGGLHPETVLVTSYGEAILGEVGIMGTIAGSLSGKQPALLAYRAPEQLSALGRSDERADVFSIGVILWELLSGRSLFGTFAQEAGQAAEAARRVRHSDIPAPGGERYRVSERVRALVDKALRRERGERFETLEAVARGFEELAAETASSDEVQHFVKGVCHEAVTARKLAVAALAAGSAQEPPTSTRPTLRPLGAAHTSSSRLKALRDRDPSLPTLSEPAFGEREAPTVRRPMPEYLAKMLDQGALGVPARALEVVPEPEDVDAEPAPESLPLDSVPISVPISVDVPSTLRTDVHSDGAATSVAPALRSVAEHEPRKRRFGALMVGAVAVLALVGAAVALVTAQRPDAPESAASPTPIQAAAPTPVPAPVVAEPPPSDQEEEADAGRTVRAAGPAEEKSRAEPRLEPKKSAPRVFRPKGI